MFENECVFHINWEMIQLGTEEIFTQFPKLETKRLILKEIKPKHAEELYNIYSDSEVMKFYDVEPLENLDQSRYYLNRFAEGYRNKMSIRWGIELKESGIIIGTCGFYNWAKKACRAEIGYELTKKNWRQGIMTEALRAIVPFAFEKMGLMRIEAYVEPENIGSIRLLNKIGFHEEGVLEEFAFYKGKNHRFSLFFLDKSE